MYDTDTPAIVEIYIPPPRMVIWFVPLLHPLEFQVQLHTFLIKIWLVRPPMPSEFPVTIVGLGMDICWTCEAQLL